MSTYQVTNIDAGNMWRVIDRSKGRKVVAFRQSFKQAAELAEKLEFSRKLTVEMLKEEFAA